MREIIGPYQFTPRQLAQLDAQPAGARKEKTRPKPKTFQVNEYLKLAEQGVLHPDARVELINGVVMQMAPIGRPHGHKVNRIARIFGRLLPDNIEINIQSTIRLDDQRLGDQSGPEPDIALLTPQASQDRQNIPGPQDILLIVEVSASSLRTDRTNKALRYAQNGIPELWIFPLESDEIEVSRQPTPQGYAHIQRYRRGDTLTIQALPQIRLTADELLA